MEELIFEIISHTGEARGLIFDSLKAARGGEFEKAKELMDKSDEEMKVAHNFQTKLIQEEINGDLKVSLLMVHAQDQLMTAMSEQQLITEMIEMYKEIKSK